ncbi:MAG: hypothetical protein C0602_00740 [Denitrovibrio sp.]|nr:MAG: hypothetical protein C0602_00740 [Denitrovibrio sp.]
MKAVWTDALASGNKTIDSQHKQLLDHINTFFDSISKEHGHETSVRTLNFLVKYVRYHFATEEELMRKTEYEHLQDHLHYHRKLVDSLMKCYKRLISDGNSEYVIQEISTLLQDWFVCHIMEHDLKLVKHLQGYEFE